MIIVFNIPALIVGLLSAAVFGLIYWIAPTETFSDGGAIITFATIVLILSALAEAETKPRVFWLPLQLWAFAFITLGVHEEFSATTFYIYFTLSVLFIVFLIYRNIVGHRNRWATAQVRLYQIRQMPHDPNNKELWMALYEAVYVARKFRYTPAVCAHNLEVATIIGTLVSEKEYNANVLPYKTAIAKGLKPGAFMFNMKYEHIASLINQIVYKVNAPVVDEAAVELPAS